MIVVSNTTPIYYLAQIGRLELLRELYGQIFLPGAVLAELTHPNSPAGAFIQPLPSWIVVEEPTLNASDFGLDLGETAAIKLALEKPADLILLDETLGRLAAEKCGLKISGTLGVLLRAVELKFIDGETELQLLEKTSFYASKKLYQAVRAKIQKLQ